MSVPKAPCKNCKDREQGCHDRCEIFLQFKEEKFKYNVQMESIRHNNAYFQENAIKCRNRRVK